MDDPTEAEDVKGVLSLTLGGAARRIAVLPIRAADQWAETFMAAARRTASAAAAVDDQADPLTAVIELTRQGNHTAVDLIVAYDRDNTLGGRDWLLDNATPEEVSDALDALRRSAFPTGLATMTMVDVARLAAQAEAAARSEQASSTNGHSPTGASPQDHLPKRSRTRSSTSSGKPASPA